jgi:glyoxylase-like metal-dependent hydrolase (beta-lactamase superfamily II)
LLLVVALVAALLASTFTAERLNPDDWPETRNFSGNSSPPPAALPETTLSLMNCGKMISRKMFIYRGAGWSGEFESGMTAALVRHPKGMFLFDTGFGISVREHFASMPWLMQKLTSYEPETAAATLLKQHGINPEEIRTVIISHSHWDHVSGCPDFPNATVLLAREEYQQLDRLPASELILRLKGGLKLEPIDLDGPPYENFLRSRDLFGDGSVVLVPLEGHTPGSIGMFVNLHSGKRFFFIGDLTWAIDGVTIPAERPWVARMLADVDEKTVRRSIVRVHELAKKYPDLVVVPAHDRRIHDKIAQLPATER